MQTRIFSKILEATASDFETGVFFSSLLNEAASRG